MGATVLATLMISGRACFRVRFTISSVRICSSYHQTITASVTNAKATLAFGSSVAVTEQFVKQHGLPPSLRSPERPDEFIYQIAGYHQLHCLVSRETTLDNIGPLSLDIACSMRFENSFTIQALFLLLMTK